ncbi:CPSF160, partial [Symbiodinium microadriaticum]
MKSAQNDEVVITFDKGKVVVVVYDVHFNSLKVINMVNAEDGAIGDAAFVASETSSSRLIHPGVGETPFISVTEDSSLSCINLNAYKLFFVPHRDQKLCASTAWAQKGFLLDLSSLYLPGAVLDKCFLSGYSRPTLAVLQDNGALPIGHSASVLHTCSLTVLAVDVATRNCVVLWRQENLPHDSLLLQPLPSSVARGGALLITNNALLIVTQESVHGLATNGFAKTTVAEKIPLVPWPLKGGVTMHA